MEINNIKKLISNKLSSSKKIIDVFNDYQDKLSPLLEDKYKVEHKNIKLLLNSFGPSIDKINKIIDVISVMSDTDLSVIIDLYSVLQDYNLSLHSLFDIYNAPQLHSENMDVSNLSQTYKLETAEYLTKLVIQFNTFIKKYEQTDNEITDYILHLLTIQLDINNVEKIREIVLDMRKLFYQHNNIVELYTLFIQEVIDQLDKTNAEGRKLMYNIMDYIEEDKDYFLSSNDNITFNDDYKIKENKDKKRIDTLKKYSNPWLKRFGLIPISESMPLKDLFTHVTNELFPKICDLGWAVNMKMKKN